MRYEILPHTADLEIRVRGANLVELFRNAVKAMFLAMKPVAPHCRIVAENGAEEFVCESLPSRRVVEIKSVDQEALLVDFLSESLALADANHEVYTEARVEIIGNRLKAELLGTPIKKYRSEEIKAVTYHGLKIEKIETGFQADIIFDI